MKIAGLTMGSSLAGRLLQSSASVAHLTDVPCVAVIHFERSFLDDHGAESHHKPYCHSVGRVRELNPLLGLPAEFPEPTSGEGCRCGHEVDDHRDDEGRVGACGSCGMLCRHFVSTEQSAVIESVTFDLQSSPTADVYYEFTREQLAELVRRGLFETGFDVGPDLVDKEYEVPVTASFLVVAPRHEGDVPVVFTEVNDAHQIIMTIDSEYDFAEMFPEIPEVGLEDVLAAEAEQHEAQATAGGYDELLDRNLPDLFADQPYTVPTTSVEPMLDPEPEADDESDDLEPSEDRDQEQSSGRQEQPRLGAAPPRGQVDDLVAQLHARSNLAANAEPEPGEAQQPQQRAEAVQTPAFEPREERRNDEPADLFDDVDVNSVVPEEITVAPVAMTLAEAEAQERAREAQHRERQRLAEMAERWSEQETAEAKVDDMDFGG